MSVPQGAPEDALGDAAGALAVLVVEDEPLVRLYAVDLLEDEGFQVIEAANADEGVALLRSRPDVRALLTDVDMPGSLDGLALARWAAATYPRLVVLVVSGKAVPAAGEMPPGARFFAKPYRGRAVLDHLRAALDAA